MKAFSVGKYLKEVRSELRQVTWPTQKDVTRLTIMVVVISVLVGAYIGILDLFFTKLIQIILKR